MKKIITHLSSRYSNFGAFNASKKIYDLILEDKTFINRYLVGRIDNVERKPLGLEKLSFIDGVITYKITYYLDKLINFFIQKKKTNNYWSNSTINFNSKFKIKKILRSDLIILYWINDGFLSIDQLDKIFKLNIPIIWRFSDMWPMTGGCHYSYECSKYKVQCCECPQLESQGLRDLASINFDKKKKWQLDNLTIVVPSSYMFNKVKKSKLFGNAKVEKIINAVDTNFFYKKKNKKKESDKFKILVGPFGKSDYLRKGYQDLEKILKIFNKMNENIEFNFFGGYAVKNSKISINHGFVKDQIQLKNLYNDCDLYLFLSKSDNSPNSVGESLSCGTPILSTKQSGVEDYCINNHNSIIIEKFDCNQIIDKIMDLKNNRNQIEKLSHNARLDAIKKFDINKMQKKFHNLIYELIL